MVKFPHLAIRYVLATPRPHHPIPPGKAASILCGLAKVGLNRCGWVEGALDALRLDRCRLSTLAAVAFALRRLRRFCLLRELNCRLASSQNKAILKLEGKVQKKLSLNSALLGALVMVSIRCAVDQSNISDFGDRQLAAGSIALTLRSAKMIPLKWRPVVFLFVVTHSFLPAVLALRWRLFSRCSVMGSSLRCCLQAVDDRRSGSIPFLIRHLDDILLARSIVSLASLRQLLEVTKRVYGGCLPFCAASFEQFLEQDVFDTHSMNCDDIVTRKNCEAVHSFRWETQLPTNSVCFEIVLCVRTALSNYDVCFPV